MGGGGGGRKRSLKTKSSEILIHRPSSVYAYDLLHFLSEHRLRNGGRKRGEL